MNITFESNNGIYGGAIHLGAINGPAKVINSKFTNNTADAHMDAIAYDGAIYVDSLDVLLDNLDFNDNMPTTQCGAIYVHEKSTYNMITNVTINNSRFNNNRVGGTYSYGGAIFTIAPHLKVYNSEFNNNSAPYGGGAILVMFLRNTIEIENCTFKNNAAKIQGGAVEIQCSKFNN